MAGIEKTSTREKLYEKKDANIVLLHKRVTEEIHRDKLDAKIAELETIVTIDPITVEDQYRVASAQEELVEKKALKEEIKGL